MGFDISMKFFSKFRILAMLVAALMAIGTRAEAQVTNDYTYFISGSPDPVGLNSNLTCTILLTNVWGGYSFVIVTNTSDVNSTFVSATNTYVYPGVSTTNNGNVVVFNLGQFGIGGNEIAQMTVIVKPTAVGYITNTVTFSVFTVTNYTYTTNIVIQVTNAAPPAQADLAVAITGPPSAVFTNDWMTYGVNVTNLGPASASNVMLTNTLPPGVGFKNYSPSNQVPSIQGSNVIFNLGTLASGAFANIQLTVQPTNAGTWTFSSLVNSTSVADPNSTNNTATNNITVGTFIYGQLIATNSSAMHYDPQIGLMTNSIRLTNIGTNVVAAARVIVSGLTNWLYNAAGTNNGNPYLISGQLIPNQATNLMLELFVPTRLPITVTNYTAVITQIASNNIQPVLPNISTQTVYELNLLTVTNTATEPSPYATTLGYGLISPPAGMSISTSGIITWTPAQNQSPSTNTITTVVTNSDPFDLVNPQLTQTNSFTVIVIPLPFVLTGPAWLPNGEFQFIINTGAGLNYTIQYSTNLTDWNSIYSFTSPGGLIPVQDPNAATSPWRFYRALLNP